MAEGERGDVSRGSRPHRRRGFLRRRASRVDARRHEREGRPGTSSRVQAAVSFFGPEDFTTRDWPPDLEREVIVPFLGGTFADRPGAYERASPVHYVTREAPPFLLFHGTNDALVPVDQSRRLAGKLRGAGVPVELVVLEGEGHGFTDAHNQESMKRMMAFLDANPEEDAFEVGGPDVATARPRLLDLDRRIRRRPGPGPSAPARRRRPGAVRLVLPHAHLAADARGRGAGEGASTTTSRRRASKASAPGSSAGTCSAPSAARGRTTAGRAGGATSRRTTCPSSS